MIATMNRDLIYEPIGISDGIYARRNRLTGRRIYYLVLVTVLTILGLLILYGKGGNRTSPISTMRGPASLNSMSQTNAKYYSKSPEVESIDPPNEGRKALPVNSGAATFVPTSEWQVVPKDAILPAGLDISIDFNTGERKARLHVEGHESRQNVPALVPQDIPDEYESGEKANMPPKPIKKTIVEGYLDDLLSDNHANRLRALNYFDTEAHRSDIGKSIMNSRNFSNLIELLQKKDVSLRRQAGIIIAAAVHNNDAAVRGAQRHQAVSRLIRCFGKERDSITQKMILASILYMVQPINGDEGDQSGLLTLKQFNSENGYRLLRPLIDNPATHDPSLIMKLIALLCEFARLELHGDTGTRSPALSHLDHILPRTTFVYDESTLDTVKLICQLEDKIKGGSPHKNILRFCQNQKLI